MLNKSLEKNKKLELYSPGGTCHLCRDKREQLKYCSCNGALKYAGYCEECQLHMQALETWAYRNFWTLTARAGRWTLNAGL